MKTRDQLITDALETAGALGLNETPTANQVTRAASALTSLLRSFHNQGMPIWKLTEYRYSFGLFTNGYAEMGVGKTLNTSNIPLKLFNVSRFDTNSNTNISLSVYARQEYLDIPSPTVTATPTQIYVQQMKTSLGVYVWPRPDSYWQTDGELVINVQEATTIPASGTDLPDFPDEFEDALILALAVRLLPKYGVPIELRQQLKKEATEALADAFAFNEEDFSVYLRPRARIF